MTKAANSKGKAPAKAESQAPENDEASAEVGAVTADTLESIILRLKSARDDAEAAVKAVWKTLTEERKLALWRAYCQSAAAVGMVTIYPKSGERIDADQMPDSYEGEPYDGTIEAHLDFVRVELDRQERVDAKAKARAQAEGEG